MAIKNIKLSETTRLDVSEGDNYSAYIELKGSKRELIYVNTEKGVYAINLIPTKINAQKIHLVWEKKEKVVLPLIGNERETIALKLVKAAYNEDEILEKSKISRRLKKRVNFSKNIEMMRYQQYEFEEDNLVLTVYIMRVDNDAEFDSVNITERMFLIPELCENPLGISISRDYLNKTEFTRLFIVGRI
jgi:hypothetical protein